MSEAVWILKDQEIEDFNIKWSVIAKEKGYNRKSRKCQLCIREKVEILRVIRKCPARTLNKRKEIFRRCLHRRKHFLGDLTDSSVLTDLNQEDHNFIPNNEN